MENESAIVILNIYEKKISEDIEIPLNITANDLLAVLNHAYKLEIDVDNVLNCYLKTENPIALLRGSKTLRDYGVRNGTIINITR